VIFVHNCPLLILLFDSTHSCIAPCCMPRLSSPLIPTVLNLLPAVGNMGRLLLCQEGWHSSDPAAATTANWRCRPGWCIEETDRGSCKLWGQGIDWPSHSCWSSSSCQEEAQVDGAKLSHDVKQAHTMVVCNGLVQLLAYCSCQLNLLVVASRQRLLAYLTYFTKVARL